MTITVDIVGVGPVEFPDGMSKEQMESALKKLPAPNRVTPTTVVPSDKSNYVVGDVPSVVGQYVQPKINQPEPKTSIIDKAKAVYEVPTTILSSMVSEPISMIYGVGREAVEDISQGKMPTGESRDIYYRKARQATQYQPTSPTSINALESIGDTLQEARIPPYIGNIGMIPSFANAKQVAKPFLQEATSNAIQTAQPVVNKMADALRNIDFAPKSIVNSAPTAEKLAIQANELFTTAKNAGVQINSKEFASSMKNISKSLENIGYDPDLHPDIKIVLKRLTDPNIPKDFNKIKALRTMIGDLQGADTKLKRSIATELKSNFDDYLATIPDSAVTSGSKEGLQAWKQGRDTWSKLLKSEIFTNMFERAELDKNGIGVQKSLTNQMRSLAKNDAKMRMFTVDEQEAIKQVAKGGSIQNLTTAFGKFAPTNTVSSIPSILATAVSAPIGLALTAGAIGSKMAATKMNKANITKLAALMRAGAKKAKDTENNKGVK
jgi:hypothetical protein